MYDVLISRIFDHILRVWFVYVNVFPAALRSIRSFDNVLRVQDVVFVFVKAMPIGKQP